MNDQAKPTRDPRIDHAYTKVLRDTVAALQDALMWRQAETAAIVAALKDVIARKDAELSEVKAKLAATCLEGEQEAADAGL